MWLLEVVVCFSHSFGYYELMLDILNVSIVLNCGGSGHCEIKSMK